MPLYVCLSQSWIPELDNILQCQHQHFINQISAFGYFMISPCNGVQKVQSFGYLYYKHNSKDNLINKNTIIKWKSGLVWHFSVLLHLEVGPVEYWLACVWPWCCVFYHHVTKKAGKLISRYWAASLNLIDIELFSLYIIIYSLSSSL